MSTCTHNYWCALFGTDYLRYYTLVDSPNEWAWVLNANGWMVFGPWNSQAESK